MGRGVWAQVPESFHAMGEQETLHPCYQSWASPCNRRSLNPSEDKITRNRMMQATEMKSVSGFQVGQV